jgi:hypothetical protein
MFDGKAFGGEVVDVVKGFVGRALDPILRRLDSLEARQPERGEKGDAGPSGRDGTDGKDAPPIADERIAEAVLRYLEANPPADGKAGADGKDGRDGDDGKDGAPGKDGIDGFSGKDGLNGADGKDGMPGEKGEVGRDGKDGVSLAGALIDRSGGLVLTLSDGTTRELGQVVGKDGASGRDGLPGRDGYDGLGFEDLTITHDGDRSFAFRMQRGDIVKEFCFTIPAMIYRGVFAEGSAYTHGDTVTWGGSLWHCDGDTNEKPGDGSKFWVLAAKRGRDGKGGEPGKPYTPPVPVKVR